MDLLIRRIKLVIVLATFLLRHFLNILNMILI